MTLKCTRCNTSFDTKKDLVFIKARVPRCPECGSNNVIIRKIRGEKDEYKT